MPAADTAEAKPTRFSTLFFRESAEDSSGLRVTSQRPPNPQVESPGHFPENEQREISGVRQPANYDQGGGVVIGTIKYFMPAGAPTPPKDKHEQLMDDQRKLQREMKSIYADLEAHKHEVRRTHGEICSFKHYINQLHHERQQSNDHMGSLQNELANVHQQQDEDARTLSEVRHENQRSKEQIESFQNELNNAHQQLEDAKALSKVHDTLSISEVGEKVTALNEQIFLAAATLGEALIHERHELSQEELDTATADSQEIVGEEITNLLISQAEKPGPKVNPLLVQVVLQIFMVKFCVSKIQSWYPSDSTIGEFLNETYSIIRYCEEQGVSGRWRALTRAYTRPSTETWTDELSQKLMAVLKIAAWMPSTPEEEASFGNWLPPIFKAVNELCLAIGEKITSADLDVSVFDSGKFYAPSYMEDAYGDGRQPSGKRAPEFIVGTTGIGLKKLSLAERDPNDSLMFENVTLAKIVLESTLKEALKPVQSSGSYRLTKKIPIENTAGADR